MEKYTCLIKRSVISVSIVFLLFCIASIYFFQESFIHIIFILLPLSICYLFSIYIIFSFFKKIVDNNSSIFEKITNMSNQGIIITSASGSIEELNIKAQSYYYENKNKIIGTSILRNLDCSLNNRKRYKAVFYNDLGSHFPAEIQIKSVIDGNKKSFIFYIDDQSNRIIHENKLKKLASEDPLTGLLNRRSFIIEFEKEIERS